MKLIEFITGLILNLIKIVAWGWWILVIILVVYLVGSGLTRAVSLIAWDTLMSW